MVIMANPTGRAWRRAMMKAIKGAAAESAFFRGSSRTFGLRAIRTFEAVNGIPFDPFDWWHCSTVRGAGVHEHLFWNLRRPT